MTGLELELRGVRLQLLHLLRTYYVPTIPGNRTSQVSDLVEFLLYGVRRGQTIKKYVYINNVRPDECYTEK